MNDTLTLEQKQDIAREALRLHDTHDEMEVCHDLVIERRQKHKQAAHVQELLLENCDLRNDLQTLQMRLDDLRMRRHQTITA